MKTIAWLIPTFGEGSGGIRTILQNADYLSKNGFQCDLYIGGDENVDDVRKKIEKKYGINIEGKIVNGYSLLGKYDLAIATYYATARIVSRSSARKKLYFIQDYEPWFFPMSINYLDADDSYKYGLTGVTIGRWLAKKIYNDYGMEVGCFSFCADLNVYKPIANTEKEKAICFIFQPDKPRRMVDLGLKALQIVKQKRPDVKIYLYGSEKQKAYNLEIEHLGLISPADCNLLYNKCSVGLCFSATNPSRIPFEMMASGLPVVELYGENTIYDLTDEGCLLAERNPNSVADAILKLLDNDEKKNRMSLAGRKYMEKYPIERGFQEFKNIVEKCINNEQINENVVNKTYKSKGVVSKNDYVVEDDVYFTPWDEDDRSSFRRKISKIKYILKEG